jgi:hypothetical protein
MRVLAVITATLCISLSDVYGAGGPMPTRLVEPKAPGRSITPASPRTQSGVNLLAFVGKKIEARYVRPKDGQVRFDAEYFLRYEILHVVFGTYPKREISFASYVHVGNPKFMEHDFGLVYVSEYDGRFVQQKNIFQPLYPTENGHWAGCGDPYQGVSDIHRHGLKPQPIAFRPAVVFDVRGLSESVIARRFPSPIFRRKGSSVLCEMGNYPEELFRVMEEGYLKARGVFGPAPR